MNKKSENFLHIMCVRQIGQPTRSLPGFFASLHVKAGPIARREEEKGVSLDIKRFAAVKRRKRDQSRSFGRESNENAPQRPASSSLRRHAQRSKGIVRHLNPRQSNFFVLFGQQPSCWPAAILLAGSLWIFLPNALSTSCILHMRLSTRPNCVGTSPADAGIFPKTYLCQDPPFDSLTAWRAKGSAGRLLPLRSLYKQRLCASFL